MSRRISVKNIFSVDITDENHHISNGNIFVTDRVPEEFDNELDEQNEETLRLMDKAIKTPLYLRILMFIFPVCGIASLRVFFDFAEDTSFAQAINDAPYILLFAIAMFIGLAFVLYILKRQSDEFSESRDMQHLERNAEINEQKAFKLLNIPKDAPEIDVMLIMYEIKKGKVKSTHKDLCDYITSIFHVFVADGMLKLASLNMIHSIPLNEITGARCIHKKVSTDAWNKDDPHNKGKYKEFKIKEGEFGSMVINTYYALDILHENEEYEILIPCYDWEIIEKLTGVKATEA